MQMADGTAKSKLTSKFRAQKDPDTTHLPPALHRSVHHLHLLPSPGSITRVLSPYAASLIRLDVRGLCCWLGSRIRRAYVGDSDTDAPTMWPPGRASRSVGGGRAGVSQKH
uniref:Uncharacterized protein n=1 Tax=Knipowitschia caucasica TaxID=637954 RepID=A0AAV2L8J5_KNICA